MLLFCRSHLNKHTEDTRIQLTKYYDTQSLHRTNAEEDYQAIRQPVSMVHSPILSVSNIQSL